MKLQILQAIAFLGGVCLAIQAGFNAQLGTILKKSILASISTAIASALFGLLFLLLFFAKDIPGSQVIRQVPWYLWLVGGLFSVVGITAYYFTIPRLGIAKMISLGLCGQLIFSMIAGHFGWLNLPANPITLKKIIGVVTMAAGIILINSK
ncbi:DMT family transporter [Parapedobacter lycopersici]|uniref:DMT family transporter n=1 Tax=Parapedobacter lycopersici TaxID=1864939 RepID=UPI00214DC599|nr:DMT family transporter [Parapedobacter lycopersici]